MSQAAERADGGRRIEFVGENAFTAIRWLGADGEKSQPYQPLARAGWGRFSLAVQLSQMTKHPKATLDGAISIDIIGKFSKVPADPSGESRHNPLTERAESAQRQQRFYLAVHRYRSDPMPYPRCRTIVSANRQGGEGLFHREFRAGEEG